MQKLVMQDHRIFAKITSEDVGISIETLEAIVTEDLQLKNFSKDLKLQKIFPKTKNYKKSFQRLKITKNLSKDPVVFPTDIALCQKSTPVIT